MQAVGPLYPSFDKQTVFYFSDGLKAYSKRNYDYMKATMESLRASQDHETRAAYNLRRPYDNDVGVYPCRSFNLGEHTASYPHTDTVNLAHSWCTITAIGSFNAKKGGHIVLHNLNLVIDFPASATVLLPSALITHSNTAIEQHETRFSIVQYASGGLFRWVKNGFMSNSSWYEKASDEEVAQRKEDENNRWAKSLEMFTKIEELVALNVLYA
jgi:hypothetical protein